MDKRKIQYNVCIRCQKSIKSIHRHLHSIPSWIRHFQRIRELLIEDMNCVKRGYFECTLKQKGIFRLVLCYTIKYCKQQVGRIWKLHCYKFGCYLQLMSFSFSRPIQWYHSHVDPFWPDGTFKAAELHVFQWWHLFTMSILPLSGHH